MYIYTADDRKADSYVQMWYAEVKDYIPLRQTAVPPNAHTIHR